jgi:hypothetical protein
MRSLNAQRRLHHGGLTGPVPERGGEVDDSGVRFDVDSDEGQ